MKSFTLIIFFLSLSCTSSEIVKEPDVISKMHVKSPVIKIISNYDNNTIKKSDDLVTTCSAVMVGSNTAITAAHCVYNNNLHSNAYLIITTSAIDINDATIDNSAVTSMVIRDECFKDPSNYFSLAHLKTSPECDFAIIIFNEPIGYTTGWVDLALPPEILNGYLIGYPGDQETIVREEAVMYKHTGGVFLATKSRIRPGMSGGAILNNRGKLVGVMIMYSKTYSFGLAINEHRINLINRTNDFVLEHMTYK